MSKRPKILVGIPCVRNSVHVNTALCLPHLTRCQADLAFQKHSGSSAEHARNMLASAMLASDFTHLLMIDDDMVFRHQAITRMIEANVDFIGLACPLRQIDMERALTLARTEPPEKAMAKSLRFNISTKNGTLIPKNNGIIEVHAIGAAISLIARATFEAMIARGVRIKKNHKEPDLSGPIYGFFDTFAAGDELVGEDYAFCHRAREAGVKIHAVIDETVRHAGQFMFTGKFSDTLTPA